MLVIEVEYLLGVAVAASPQRDRPEWPPHPARLFSTLVAGWGDGGCRDDERAALEWLEAQPAPLVQASAKSDRVGGDVYVPPNDFVSTGDAGTPLPKDLRPGLAVLPAHRSRQIRHFSAAVPDDPVVRFAWPEARPEAAVLDGLRSLASRTGYLGHSSSVVRLAIRTGGALDETALYRPAVDGQHRLRWVRAGRLDELASGYRDARGRGAVWRPEPGETRRYSGPDNRIDKPAVDSVFGEDWVVLEDDGGKAPLLTAFPKVAKVLHRALVEICAQRLGRDVPELLSGKAPDGTPTPRPHMAILPLADVGWTWSAGRLMGLALALPRQAERRHGDPEVDAVYAAIGAFARTAPHVTLGQLGVWPLAAVKDSSKASLRPDRYVGPSRAWASVTPVVLDRFAKDKPGEGWQDLVALSCGHAGLPLPIGVSLYKHSAFVGAPPAVPSGGNPAWTDWVFPEGSPLQQRRRTHVVLEFRNPVRGPVVLGAGRFQGMGLCLPLGRPA